MGVTPEDPRYEPSVDGGLCIEVMPIEPLQLPPDTFAVPAPKALNLEPGQMVISVDARKKWFGRIEKEPEPGDNVTFWCATAEIPRRPPR